MRYQKPLASYRSPTALKRPDRSKRRHCLEFANLDFVCLCKATDQQM